MLDLVCSRYSGKKPSQYLGINDDVSAFEVDSAIALKGHFEEVEMENARNEAILQGLDNVCRSFGAKVPKKTYYKKLLEEEEKDDELPLLDDLLIQLGGNGVVFQK